MQTLNRRYRLKCGLVMLWGAFLAASSAAQVVPQWTNTDAIKLMVRRNVFVVGCKPRFMLRHGPIWRLRKSWCLTGSGVDLGNGTVLSAYHIVRKEKAIYVNGAAESLLASDEKIDLALISFHKSDKNLPALRLGNPAQGELVLSTGNPYENLNKIAVGFVTSSTSWALWHDACKPGKNHGRHPTDGGPLILSSTYTNPGYSGGGQYAVDGTLMGIHEGIWTDGSSVTISSRDIAAFLREHGTALPRF